jgi:hypothetical protein
LSEPAETKPLTEEPLIDAGEWPDASAEVPIGRRARRLTPLTGGLLAVAIAAVGFVAGVLIEKGQTSSSGGSLPGALSSASGGPAGALTRAGSGGSGPTLGTVANVSGRTLYVTDAQGNTIKVLTSKSSTVSRSAESKVADIHPGDTVVIQGPKRRSGTVSAQSIQASAAGSGGGTLLGGAPTGTTAGGSSQSSGGGQSGGAGAVDQLFGN